MEPPAFAPDALRDAPLDRAETIPSAWYTDARFHAWDRRAVFGRAWQYVGPAAWLDAPGAYVTAEVAGEPVIVVRDGDVLRGFYNVCRHRGGPLATDDRGQCRMLQCKYHGWTYRLDGSLRGLPRWDRVDLFDRSDYALVPVAVSVWQGLVFAHLDADAPPLADRFGGIPERIAPIDLAAMRFERRVVYDVACNWKVYVDNYLEGYHLPLVHPELCNLLDYAAYTVETFLRYSLQTSPLDAEESVYSDTGGQAFYYFVYPDFMLNVLPNRVQLNRVVPTAPDRCRVWFDYYYTDGHAHRANADAAYSDRIQQEDAEICEHVQRGLMSRGYDRGRFSVECEAAVHHFQMLLKADYRLGMEERKNRGMEEGKTERLVDK